MLKANNRIKSKGHLKFVSKYKCALDEFADFECNGVIQSHHLLKPYDGVRGMGMKASDNNAVPLCQFHHHKLHFVKGNEDKFWVDYGLTEDFGREIAKHLWSISPFNK